MVPRLSAKVEDRTCNSDGLLRADEVRDGAGSTETARHAAKFAGHLEHDTRMSAGAGVSGARHAEWSTATPNGRIRTFSAKFVADEPEPSRGAPGRNRTPSGITWEYFHLKTVHSANRPNAAEECTPLLRTVAMVRIILAAALLRVSARDSAN